jgi:hypothetical protein
MKLPVELSKTVGCHPDYIRKINRGVRRPSPAMSRKIIEAARARGIELSLNDLRPDFVELAAVER